MKRAPLSLVLTLAACAANEAAAPSAAAPGASPPSAVAPQPGRGSTLGPEAAPDAGGDGQSLAAQLEAMDLGAIGAGGGSESALSTFVAELLGALNSRDRGRAQALCTPACWAGECRSFAEQAGTKFEARASTMVERGDRAVVSVDVVCPGKGLCDRVSLLVVRAAGGLRVADITESEKKAREFLDGGR